MGIALVEPKALSFCPGGKWPRYRGAGATQNIRNPTIDDTVP